MTPEDFDKIAELFESARQKSLEERAAFLDVACADSPALRADVESLLAHHDEDSASPTGSGAGAVLRKIAAQFPDDSDSDRTKPFGGALSESAESLPANVGPYAILSKIGEGGMGVVYRARQENPNRIVALKVLRSGAVPPTLLKRFELEANVLGRLQHVGIAQIFEAGTAAPDDSGSAGRPFLAMELIEGLPLTEHADTHALSPNQRLETFALVCDAAHHAHMHGIIHRDLKPGNVLVDLSGQPKILDFGVARATDSDMQATTMHTDMGQLIGTIPYMSPEQVTGDPHALDIRSDVYSLGVLLYRLLAGRLPYAMDRQTIPEAIRTIQTVEPDRLSTINTVFRGDIETIVAKALEKDRTRRYQSAAELAADIRRYLGHEPIVARPTSAIYQFRKFARRNTTLVASMAAIFVILIAGVAVSTSQAFRALRAERLAHDRLNDALAAKVLAEEGQTEAEVQTKIARAVNDFLNNDLLAAVDPSNTADRQITMREVLEAAALKIDGSFEDQPLVEASIRVTIGRTFQGLGEYDMCVPHLQRALNLRRAALGEEDRDTLEAMGLLARLYDLQGKYADAEPLYLKTQGLQMRVLGKDDQETLATANNLGALYLSQGRYEEAERLYLANFETGLRVLGEENVDTLQSMNNLGAMYAAQGKFASATALLEKVLQVQRRVLGEEHPSTLAVLHNTFGLLLNQGKLEEATPIATKVLAIKRRVLGTDHPDTLRALNDLATLYGNQSMQDKALPLQREALEIQRRTLGDDHPDTLRSMNTLGGIYLMNEMYDEAEPLYVASLEARRRLLGDEHLETAVSLATLGALYNKQGRHAEAEPLIEEALGLARRMLPKTHFYTGAFLRYYGHCLTGRKRYADAEAALLESYQILSNTFGDEHPQTVGAIKLLGNLYESRHTAEPGEGYDVKAAEWREKMPENESDGE